MTSDITILTCRAHFPRALFKMEFALSNVEKNVTFYRNIEQSGVWLFQDHHPLL